jgi:hypothetical protein
MTKAKAKFKVGDIVRYSDGATGLMKIEAISLDHGSAGTVRYYGDQFYGVGAVAAYENECKPASKADLNTWENAHPKPPEWPRISKQMLALLEEFDTCAKAWGWSEDQGNGKQVEVDQRNYQNAKMELMQAIRDLENAIP